MPSTGKSTASVAPAPPHAAASVGARGMPCGPGDHRNQGSALRYTSQNHKGCRLSIPTRDGSIGPQPASGKTAEAQGDKRFLRINWWESAFVSPAHGGSVRLQCAGVGQPGADRGELPLGSSARVAAADSPAGHRPVGSQPAITAYSNADGHILALGGCGLPGFVPAPAHKGTVLAQCASVIDPRGHIRKRAFGSSSLAMIVVAPASDRAVGFEAAGVTVADAN